MKRIRSFIYSFSAILCTAGLLLATLHIHELVNNHSYIPDEVVHILDQAHDTCPICAVVFEGIGHTDSPQTIYFQTEEQPVFLSHQVVFSPVYTDKDGRSPPIAG